MNFEQRILSGNAKAWARVADIVRAGDGTYQDAFEWICEIFKTNHKPAPELRDFEAKMQEAEE